MTVDQETQRVGIRTHWDRLYYRCWWLRWNHFPFLLETLRHNRNLTPLTLPPMEDLLWELAVYSRTLSFVQKAAESGDHESLRLSSRLANVLHNGPDRVVTYYRGIDWDNLPCVHDDRAGVAVKLWPYFAERHIPERLFAEIDKVFSPEGLEAELGVNTDHSNVDLAPEMKYRLYSLMLWWACIAIRRLSMEAPCPERAESNERIRRLAGTTARLLQPIPSALVRWNEFDEKAFRRASRPDWSEDQRYLDQYLRVFKQFRPL